MKEKPILIGITIFNLLIFIGCKDSDSRVEVFPQLGHDALSAEFSPCGKYIISGSNDDIKLWDAATGREIRTFSAESGSGGLVCFSPNGRQVLSSHDGVMRLWDTETGREIKSFTRHNKTISEFGFSPDGKNIFSVSDFYDGGILRTWNVNSGRIKKTFPGDDIIISADYSPGGQKIVAASIPKSESYNDDFLYEDDYEYSENNKYLIKILDARSGKELKRFSQHINGLSVLLFDPSGEQIVIGAKDGTIRFLDTESEAEVLSFSGHSV